VTDPDRRRSSDAPGRRSDRTRPLILLAGIFAIVLAAAGVAFVLGGGPGGLGSATTPPTAGPSLSVSLPPGTALPAPSGAPPQTAVPGPSTPPASDGEPGIRAKRIRIDRLGIDLAIVQGDGIDAPIGKAAHYPSSAWPGGGSNIYIYGHARTGMFIRLWEARVGDTVQLVLVDGTSRTYAVTKVLPTVPWDAVQYLEPTPTEQLTLQTSTSYYPTAPRFVVIAVPAT
jgi:LPXTG-site transpeptidase (sortase) family protein